MSARTVDRRAPSNATLRRLVMTGNLLAAAARDEIDGAHDLADAWDSLLDALRAELAEPRTRGQVASEVPLGAEADVSHVQVPKGRAR